MCVFPLMAVAAAHLLLFLLVLSGAAQHTLLKHPSGITGTVSLPCIWLKSASKTMIPTFSPQTPCAYHIEWPLSYGLPYRNTTLMDSLHTCMQLESSIIHNLPHSCVRYAMPPHASCCLTSPQHHYFPPLVLPLGTHHSHHGLHAHIHIVSFLF
jgi:hypothetical protein